MNDKYSAVAAELIQHLGGKENIISVTHCMTRVRFDIKDRAKIDEKAVKMTDTVIGVMDTAGQYQVVIGDEVGQVYNALVEAGLKPLDSDIVEEPTEKKNESIFDKVLDVISGVMTPLIPALIAGGMVKALIGIIAIFSPDFAATSTYNLLSIVGDSVYYFLPVFIAVNAAHKFKVNTALALMMATAILHPNFIEAVNSGDPLTFLKLPVASVSYSSSVFPIILVIWFMSVLQKGISKVIPKNLKIFAEPTLLILITTPIALVVLAPLGNYLGVLFGYVINFLHSSFGIFAIVVVAALYPFLVMLGMHHVLTPIMITTLSTMGYEGIVLAGIGASNWAETGACLGVALRAKKSETKQLAFSSCFSGVMGITEPALYGITLRYKKPLYAACIAATVAGLVFGIFGCVYYSIPMNVFMLVPSLVGDKGIMNLVVGIASTVIAFVLSAVLAYVFGVDEEAK